MNQPHRFTIRVVPRLLLPGVRVLLYERSQDFGEACWSVVADSFEDGWQQGEVQRALLEGTELL